MPVKSPPRERPLLLMFLAEYEHGAWKDAIPDWVEERIDGAVEVVAQRADGQKLAIEHTIVQPFVDEKKDSNIFLQVFGRIEKNLDLTLPDRALTVEVPVTAVPAGYKWEEVGSDLLGWLKANHQFAPKEGEAKHTIQVGASSKLGPLALDIKLHTMHLSNDPGSVLISRGPMPKNLCDIVEKALADKVPKLVATAANKRVLLIERQHVSLADNAILNEIRSLFPNFAQLEYVDEVCIVDTSIWESEGWVYFRRFDDHGILETIAFNKGALEQRHGHGR